MAILADPRHPDAYAALASIFMAEGKFAKALKVLDQAVKVDPLSADSHGNRAVLYLAMRQYARALDDLDEVLRVAPNSSRALRERAWILATCADPKIRDGGLAVTAAAKACELTGWQDISSIGTLAAACAEAGDLAGAVKWQKRVMELLPQQSPEFDDQKRLLDRYLARKPYRRLTLLEERGLSESRAEEKQAQ
jgi:serine/threonine-protein kinase